MLNQSINQSINKITLALAISVGSSLFSSAVWAAEWTLTGNNSGSAALTCNGTSCNNFKSLLQKVSDGDTINLTGDNTLLARDGSSIEETLTIDKSVTINGNGHTLKLGGHNNISLEKDVNLTNITLLTNRSDTNKLFPTSAYTNSANIFLNGNKLSLNNVGTKTPNRPELNPNIIIGAMEGKQDAGHGELLVTNSTDETKFSNIVAGSPTNPQANNHTVKISLDKNVIDGKDGGKIYLGNGEGKSEQAGPVELTISSGDNNSLAKLDQNHNNNINLNLSNVKSPLGKLPLTELANLNLDNSTVKVENINIRNTLTLANGSEVRIQNPVSYDDGDEDTPVTTTINNINTTDDGSELNLFTDNINLTISNITGNTPKLKENGSSSVTITLPEGYETTQDEQGRRTIRSKSQSTEEPTKPEKQTQDPPSSPSDSGSTTNTESAGENPTSDNTSTSGNEAGVNNSGDTDQTPPQPNGGNDQDVGDTQPPAPPATNTDNPPETEGEDSGAGSSGATTGGANDEASNGNLSSDSGTPSDQSSGDSEGDQHSSSQNGGQDNAQDNEQNNTSQDDDNTDDQTGNGSVKPDSNQPPETTTGDEGQSTGEQPPSDAKPSEEEQPSKPQEEQPDQPSDQPEQPPKPAKPAETPKPAPEKNTVQPSTVKQQILKAFELLKHKLTGISEKDKQVLVEKTEQSLQNLAQGYSSYDFSFSIDAARIAEARLNELAFLNGIESASTNNNYLMYNAQKLKKHHSLWISSSLGEQKGEIKRRTKTLNLGVDEQFENLILGVFVSYLEQSSHRDSVNSKLRGYALSWYGKYSPQNHDITLLINYGKTSGTLNRTLSGFGISNQADLKSKFGALKVEYGYRLPFDRMNLQAKPLVGLMFNVGEQKPFTERGTLPVSVSNIHAQRLALEVGVELKKYFDNAYVYLKPTIQTDLMARTKDIHIRFVNTPNSIPFTSNNKKKTYLSLALGTQVQVHKNLLVELNLNGRTAKQERDIQGNIKFTYKF